MWKYILRRILIFIPTLFAITLLGFMITINAPGDPVDTLMKTGNNDGDGQQPGSNTSELRKFWQHKLGLDLPVFYIAFTRASMPDTLHRVTNRQERTMLKRMVAKHGNWTEISAYYHSLYELARAHEKTTIDSSSSANYGADVTGEVMSSIMVQITNLRITYDPATIAISLEDIRRKSEDYRFLQPLKKQIGHTLAAYEAISSEATPYKNYVPSFRFYGMNQYHRWLFGDGNPLTAAGAVHSRGLIRGDFGLSYTTQEPVSRVIRRKIGWSLFFTLFSVFMGYLVSIPLGVEAARRHGKWFDKTSSVFLFILYSLPNFFVATLLLMYFSNPDYLNLFESSGVKPTRGYPEGSGIFEKLRITLPFLVLPAICYTYSAFAFLSRTMRVSVLEVLNQDFIRTARAKGLTEKKVIYRHALRNALLPIITVFANIFPVAIGGSVILETIFTIPGIGLESYTAIFQKNYPIIIALFTLTGLLTLAGYLVSDILYAIADPRISYSKK